MKQIYKVGDILISRKDNKIYYITKVVPKPRLTPTTVGLKQPPARIYQIDEINFYLSYEDIYHYFYTDKEIRKMKLDKIEKDL